MHRPDLRSLTGRRVLVTGAASGIGRATALALAAQGAELVLTDRAPLEEVADLAKARGGRVAVAAEADVADVDAVRDLAARVHAQVGSPDVVMNVAGISTWGTVDRLTHEQWRRQVEVNLMGPIHVVESFVPAMIEAGRGGHLVNVSSAAALLGLPMHAAYSAAKYGLRGVSEVLRFDLRQHGIGVSLVCPGAVNTPLTGTVEIAGVDIDHPAVAAFRRRFERRAVTPEHVAGRILDAVAHNRYLVYTSADIRAAHLLERWAPPAYALAMRGLQAQAARVMAQASA